MKGNIVGTIDTAQVVLYAFWVFFGCLIFYLRREDKREGYPLEADITGREEGVFYPPMPSPKTFNLPQGGTVTVPSGKGDTRPIRGEKLVAFPGSPLEPTGNPMLDCIGPASYAERSDTPDITWHGLPRIVPMRVAPDFNVVDAKDSPVGFDVIGTDRAVGGTIKDVWVDRSECIARYYEVALAGQTRTVLLPVTFSNVDIRRGIVKVSAITAAQFTSVPGLKNPDQVTLLEEDRIVGYYGGGLLYATPARAEPLL